MKNEAPVDLKFCRQNLNKTSAAAKHSVLQQLFVNKEIFNLFQHFEVISATAKILYAETASRKWR